MASMVPDSYQNDQYQFRVTRFFKQAKVGTFLYQSNIHKEKGFSAPVLVQFIFSLVLQGKNLYRTLEADRLPDAPGGGVSPPTRSAAERDTNVVQLVG
nr:hypothetical protein [Salicibibacter cibarius]